MPEETFEDWQKAGSLAQAGNLLIVSRIPQGVNNSSVDAVDWHPDSLGCHNKVLRALTLTARERALFPSRKRQRPEPFSFSKNP